MSFILVKEAVNRALKGELQGAIRETIQGANQDALQSILSRLFQEALKGPPNTFQLKHFQVHF